MANSFFNRPILNSPYEYPARHWKLEEDGRPTNQISKNWQRSALIRPVPKIGCHWRFRREAVDRWLEHGGAAEMKTEGGGS